MTARPVLLLLVPLILFGCQSVPPKGGFDDVQKSVNERIGQPVQWNQGTQDDKKIQQAVEKRLAAPLTQDAAIAIALINNRRLQATYEDLGVAQANLIQAGLLKNPRIGANYLLPVDSGPVPKVGLDLSDDFLDVFFIPLRKSVAESQFEMAKAKVTLAVMDHAARTAQAYVEYQAASQNLELQQVAFDASSAAFETTQKLFQAGNINKLSVATGQVRLAEAQLDLNSAKAQLSLKREDLNREMGLWGPQAGKWEVKDRLANIPENEIELKEAERRAVEKSVDLAAARARMQALAHQAGMTNWSTLLSDLQIGVTGDRENDGAWSVGPSASLQIPIFDQGQAAKSAAASHLRRAIQDYYATAVEVRTSARIARDQLIDARIRAVYVRDVLLPARHDAVDETMTAYNGMLAGVFQLLSTRQQEVQAHAVYVRALERYWLARARFEGVLAGRAGVDEAPSPANDSSFDP